MTLWGPHDDLLSRWHGGALGAIKRNQYCFSVSRFEMADKPMAMAYDSTLKRHNKGQKRERVKQVMTRGNRMKKGVLHIVSNSVVPGTDVTSDFFTFLELWQHGDYGWAAAVLTFVFVPFVFKSGEFVVDLCKGKVAEKNVVGLFCIFLLSPRSSTSAWDSGSCWLTRPKQRTCLVSRRSPRLRLLAPCTKPSSSLVLSFKFNSISSSQQVARCIVIRTYFVRMVKYDLSIQVSQLEGYLLLTNQNTRQPDLQWPRWWASSSAASRSLLPGWKEFVDFPCWDQAIQSLREAFKNVLAEFVR